ncbi:YtcA family lipoprotein [Silvibacterium acidisoli]|uniref:YtcA family lipoprotein n=1 Tax=Acidobacteriaceae bacterium ZG23-2 TaxID=2883246 RepID=UPI00406C370E
MKKTAILPKGQWNMPRLAPFAGLMLLSGCGRAPSFNILGSFFPAWLICMIAGVIVAALLNWVLVLYKWDRNIPWGIVTYPCIAAFFAFTMWLVFFA